MGDYIEPVVGESYCISLSALYGEKLAAGAVSDDTAVCSFGIVTREGRGELDYACDYFDFRANRYYPAQCMDGEDCEVVGVSGNGSVTLVNSDGERDAEFVLDAEEFQIAAGAASSTGSPGTICGYTHDDLYMIAETRLNWTLDGYGTDEYEPEMKKALLDSPFAADYEGLIRAFCEEFTYTLEELLVEFDFGNICHWPLDGDNVEAL